jgi:hypothetical protein
MLDSAAALETGGPCSLGAPDHRFEPGWLEGPLLARPLDLTRKRCEPCLGGRAAGSGLRGADLKLPETVDLAGHSQITVDGRLDLP